MKKEDGVALLDVHHTFAHMGDDVVGVVSKQQGETWMVTQSCKVRFVVHFASIRTHFKLSMMPASLNATNPLQMLPRGLS